MQRLFALAGNNEAQAKAAADTVLRLETRTRNRRSTTSSCAIRSRPITR